MLQVLHQNHTKQYIESQGVRFLVLSSIAEYDAALLKDSDAVIIGDLEQSEGLQLLREIRRSREEKVG